MNIETYNTCVIGAATNMTGLVKVFERLAETVSSTTVVMRHALREPEPYFDNTKHEAEKARLRELRRATRNGRRF